MVGIAEYSAVFLAVFAAASVEVERGNVFVSRHRWQRGARARGPTLWRFRVKNRSALLAFFTT